jgi:hypothetical protein
MKYSETKNEPNGRLQALHANIKLGWKLMPLANTLAYHDAATISVVIDFIVQAPGENG